MEVHVNGLHVLSPFPLAFSFSHYKLHTTYSVQYIHFEYCQGESFIQDKLDSFLSLFSSLSLIVFPISLHYLSSLVELRKDKEGKWRKLSYAFSRTQTIKSSSSRSFAQVKVFEEQRLGGGSKLKLPDHNAQPEKVQ